MIPQESLDPVRQVTWGEEVMRVVINCKLGAHLEALCKALFITQNFFLIVDNVSVTVGRIN